MPKSHLNDLPEAFVSTKAMSVAVSRAQRQGRLRKIGSRLYTKNLTDSPEQIVRRNLWPLVAGYLPGALIADRTALENVPAEDGSVFVVADHKRDIVLPGITIRPRRGVPPLKTDLPFVGGLYISSVARAFLENLAPSRRRGGRVGRTFDRGEIERRLETLVRRGGPAALNRLRDEAGHLAKSLDRLEEFQALDRLIGALLGTRHDRLVTKEGRARRAGRPFDPERTRLFERLYAELRSWPVKSRPAPRRTAAQRATLAFFEAYFSNFIEGTEFDIGEAADIVFRGKIPSGRPADAHDVLGTWRIVSDPSEMKVRPADGASLLEILRARHATIMAARPDRGPGRFKDEINRAGLTVFVAPDLVEGTLLQGYDFYRSLKSPFARAVFLTFLVAEVHPFVDGNGRIARIMMNAELVAAGEERVVIPTVYRNNYLDALRGLSQTGRTEPLIRVLDYAQRWTAAVPWTALDKTRAVLESCNAFAPPEGADAGFRLRFPKRTRTERPSRTE